MKMRIPAAWLLAAAGLLLAALLIAWWAVPGQAHAPRVTGAVSAAPQLLTAGQNAAIQGALELLLITPGEYKSFVPRVTH